MISIFQIIASLVTFLACAAAVEIGYLLGSGNMVTAFLVFGGVIGLIYFSRAQQAIPYVTLMLALMGLSFYPFGFGISGTELICLLGLVLYAMNVWAVYWKARSEYPREWKSLHALLLLWLLFVGLRLLFNLLAEGSGGGVKNVLKNYFESFVPYFMLILYMKPPASIRIDEKSFEPALGFLLRWGIILSIAMRSYQYQHAPVTVEGGETISPAYYIPGLWLVENIFALRGLGPLATLAGALWWTEVGKGFRHRFRGLRTMLVGLLGAALSGGRASLFMAGLYLLAVLVLRKRYLSIAGLIGGGILMVWAATLFQNQINELPYQIARSLQYLVINHEGKTSGEMANSARWRGDVHQIAVQEWLATPVSVLVGNGFKGYSPEE